MILKIDKFQTNISALMAKLAISLQKQPQLVFDHICSFKLP